MQYTVVEHHIDETCVLVKKIYTRIGWLVSYVKCIILTFNPIYGEYNHILGHLECKAVHILVNSIMYTFRQHMFYTHAHMEIVIISNTIRGRNSGIVCSDYIYIWFLYMSCFIIIFKVILFLSSSSSSSSSAAAAAAAAAEASSSSSTTTALLYHYNYYDYHFGFIIILKPVLLMINVIIIKILLVIMVPMHDPDILLCNTCTAMDYKILYLTILSR